MLLNLLLFGSLIYQEFNCFTILLPIYFLGNWPVSDSFCVAHVIFIRTQLLSA